MANMDDMEEGKTVDVIPLYTEEGKAVDTRQSSHWSYLYRFSFFFGFAALIVGLSTFVPKRVEQSHWQVTTCVIANVFIDPYVCSTLNRADGVCRICPEHTQYCDAPDINWNEEDQCCLAVVSTSRQSCTMMVVPIEHGQCFTQRLLLNVTQTRQVMTSIYDSCPINDWKCRERLNQVKVGSGLYCRYREDDWSHVVMTDFAPSHGMVPFVYLGGIAVGSLAIIEFARWRLKQTNTEPNTYYAVVTFMCIVLGGGMYLIIVMSVVWSIDETY